MDVKKRHLTVYILSFLFPFLLTWVFFLISDIAPAGSKVIMTGDLDRQFIDFFSYFRSVFTTKNDALYTLEKNLGGDMPGLAAYYINDPLLFLLFLFPGKYIATGTSVLFSVQTALCGLTFCVYLNKTPRFHHGENEPAAFSTVLFSTAYAMNGFVFGYQPLMIYFSNLIILPLILLMFDRIMLDRRRRYIAAYSLLLALYIFMNYYMGFMLAVFLILYFVFYLINDRSLVKGFVPVAVSSVSGVLISAFSLIPTVLSLEGEKSTAMADWSIHRKFRLIDLPGGFFSGMSRNDRMPFIYCSVFVLICALCYFFRSGKDLKLKEKLSYAFLIAALSVSMYINPIDNIWHGFNNPVGFPWRYSYFLSIVVIMAGYEWFRDHELSGSINPWPQCIVIPLYFGCLIVTRNNYFDTQRMIVNICLVSANIAVILLAGKREKIRRVMIPVLFLLLFADLTYNSRVAFVSLNGEGEDLGRFYEEYDEISAAADHIKSADGSFYRMEKDFYRTPNDTMMFDYMGITHSSSCEKESVRHFLSRFGFRDTGLYAFYNLGSTTFADCFLGIKYYISRFDQVHKPYEYMEGSHEAIGKYFAYKNPYALDIASYAPGELAGIDVEKGNTFEMQNSIARAYGADDIYIEAGHELNIRDGNERHYEIRIDRDGPLYYYFDAPHMQGAEIYVNGEYREPYFTETNWSVLCAGIFKTGDNVDIVLKPTQDDIEVTEACFYHEDTEAIRRFYQAACPGNDRDKDAETGGVKVITSSHLRGQVLCSGTGYIMFTLPYEEAWRITLDGEKAKPVKLLGNLLAVQTGEGLHEIDMQYVPSGLIAGIILSIAGVLFLFVYIGRNPGVYQAKGKLK